MAEDVAFIDVSVDTSCGFVVYLCQRYTMGRILAITQSFPFDLGQVGGCIKSFCKAQHHRDI